MSYTPNTWQTGDTVTAAKLNNMEQGIEKNAGYWIPVQYSSGTFSVPADKVDEVLYALHNPDNVFINGVAIGDLAFYGGYRVNENEFCCPLSAEVMKDAGMLGTGNIIIKRPVGVADVSVEVVPDTFIVTLTPTALDYSGTMDKTVAEIDAAYQSGKEIVFRIYSSLTESTDVKLSSVYKDTLTYPSFNAYIILYLIGVLVFAYTSTTDDGTKNTYSTVVYSLTPAS